MRRGPCKGTELSRLTTSVYASWGMMLKGAHVLITGGAGFIGTALAARLADDNHVRVLDILRRNMEDHTHNTTRFIIMAREPKDPDPSNGPIMTSFVFQVRNVPASLYKAMGGFATNGVNMTKLESYMVNGEFSATQFYADIEGHPSQTNVRLALEELGFFSRAVKVLGVYPASRAGIED